MGRFKFPLLIMAFACSGSLAFAERPAGKLAWDQDAPNLAAAQSYQYSLVVDGGPPRLLGDVRCVGAVAPFTCAAPLPELGVGTHSLTVTAAVLTDRASLASQPSAPLLTMSLNGTTLTCSSAASC